MWTHLGYVPTFYQCYTKLKAYIFYRKIQKETSVSRNATH